MGLGGRGDIRRVWDEASRPAGVGRCAVGDIVADTAIFILIDRSGFLNVHLEHDMEKNTWNRPSYARIHWPFSTSDLTCAWL